MIRRFRAIPLALCVALSEPAAAHCDTTGGPVVADARAALEAGDAALVLHWVRADDEPAIREAFRRTMEVRALGHEARALADRYFFETLVRVHRAGEGASYTGLKEGAPDPIIAATDRALETGSVEELERHLVEAVRAGLRARFAAARAAKERFEPGEIEGGRAFVAAYVPLTHWVERVAAAASGAGVHGAPATGHDEPGGADHGSLLPQAPWMVAALLLLVLFRRGAPRRRAPPP